MNNRMNGSTTFALVQQEQRLKRILFILKYRYGYFNNVNSFSSGLKNSVEMLVEMLNKLDDVKAKCVEVIDNNSIDKEVHLFRPNIVIIEALWVVPEKFDVLIKLYPNIKWIVRLHSKTEFLAGEGIAFDWIPKYLQKGVYIGCNSLAMFYDIRNITRQIFINKDMVEYLPNYYQIGICQNLHSVKRVSRNNINIGCFGSIRPLKNQMNQALAVVEFSNIIKTPVNFHINSSRTEGRGEPVLKNIRNLFKTTPFCSLVEHEWLTHNEFLKLLSEMDISLQASFSETFNIVAADSIFMGIPVISSKYIDWLNSDTDIDADDITKSILKLYRKTKIGIYLKVLEQQIRLKIYSCKSLKVWNRFISEQK